MLITGKRDWLEAIYKPLRGNFREVICVSLFVNLMLLALPVFILQVYDRVVMHNGISTLYALTFGMAVILLFDFLLRQTRSRMLQWASVRVDAGLGEKVFDKVLSLPLAQLEKRSTNNWQILFRDVDVVRNTICGPTALLAVDLPFAVLFLGLIYVIAAPVAWVLAIAVPCFILLALRSGRVMEGASQDERQALIDRDTLLSELLSARGTVKALALETSLKPRWEDRHANGIENSLKRGMSGDAYINFGTVLVTLTTVTMTAVGALSILQLEMTIGSLIAANMLGNRVIGPMNQLVGSWRNFAHYKQSLKRLDELFDMNDETVRGNMNFDRPAGALAVEGISYHYDPEQPPVLNDISFSIPSGGMLLGIVGCNGSGKTTLLKLLRGLYHPSTGRVLFDGGDIGQFSHHQLAGWIGTVPQHVTLFTGSIRDNIAITHPDASDAEIIAAAKLVGVHEYVSGLPEGYETDVGEAGGRLSGGEVQRIAIARALLKDPPVLLLDEPTSNLDLPAQRSLIDVLAKLAEDHTIVVITHAPALLAKCGHLVVLDNGVQRMSGPADQVLPWLTNKQPDTAAALRPKAIPS